MEKIEFGKEISECEKLNVETLEVSEFHCKERNRRIFHRLVFSKVNAGD